MHSCIGNKGIIAKTDKVMTTMNNDKQNNYIVHVPLLWCFMPHCFITPQHILKNLA